jgi:hypothetical protein
MGLLSKDPAKEQAKVEAREAETRARAEAQEAKARAEQEARFWASAQGQARKAHQDGRSWFQMLAPVSDTRLSTTGFVRGEASSDVTSRASDWTNTITIVEAEGWKLEHVGYVFQPTATASRDKLLSSGQTEQIAGKIVGIYLFRRVEGALP